MSRALSAGMTGEDVAVLQRLLNHHLGAPRAPLATDGNFGPLTTARVKEFQTLNRLYPTLMRFPDGVSADARKPLQADGIVGQHTLLVLLDTRELSVSPDARFRPKPLVRTAAAPRFGPQPAVQPVAGAPRFGVTPISDPALPPSRTFRMIQLSAGQQATINPWLLSPFMLTGQFVLLAKNEGTPDFLLTAGGQASLNDGGNNGRWTGQGFVQMGLGGFPKLFGKLDLLNPFTSLMLSKNEGQPATFGLAFGNQSTWTLTSRPLPGTKDDMQDTLSFFFNAQAVANVDLTNGRGSAPGGQFLIGSILTFF